MKNCPSRAPSLSWPNATLPRDHTTQIVMAASFTKGPPASFWSPTSRGRLLLQPVAVVVFQPLSRVRLFATPQTGACQAPLSLALALQEGCSLPCLGLQGFDLWSWILSTSGTFGRTCPQGVDWFLPVKGQDKTCVLLCIRPSRAPHSQPHSEPSTTATLPGVGSHGTASSTAAGMEHAPSTRSEPDTKMSFTNTR